MQVLRLDVFINEEDTVPFKFFCAYSAVRMHLVQHTCFGKVNKTKQEEFGLGMGDNFEYGNFKNLTSTLRHQTGLCVGNLVPHFQHIVIVGQL